MNKWCLALGVGCAVLTASVSAGGLSTNLLEKAQLKQLDKNRNNILDYKELDGLPKAQCEAALDAYDINSDGEITAAELERVPRTKESMEKEAKRLQQEKQKQAAAKKQQQVAKKPEPKKAEPKKVEPKKADPKKPAPKKPAPKPDPKNPVKK
jgi:neurofilament heavy polypeptide